jgi:hypothetical protein
MPLKLMIALIVLVFLAWFCQSVFGELKRVKRIFFGMKNSPYFTKESNNPDVSLLKKSPRIKPSADPND